MNTIESIITQYKERVKDYASLEKVTNGLISTLISNRDIEVHSITSRVKTEKSLLGKINRPEKNYKELNDVTDVIGIRITTYFSDHVDMISELIEKEFDVDADNSIDKRKVVDPERFGYMSLHLVAQHSSNRIKLPEYANFKSIKFEFQIRTILQHAWAEIEHDIGYKTAAQVPHVLRRRFSRLSGLLELADEEFFAIRNEIEGYKNDLVTDINTNPESILLDLDSIGSLIHSDKDITKLEDDFSKIFSCKLHSQLNDSISANMERLSALGIETIKDLKDAYKEILPYAIPFLKNWLTRNGERNNFSGINRGISLLYLTYIILALRNDDKLFNDVLSASTVNFLEKDKMPNQIRETFNKIKI